MIDTQKQHAKWNEQDHKKWKEKKKSIENTFPQK